MRTPASTNAGANGGERAGRGRGPAAPPAGGARGEGPGGGERARGDRGARGLGAGEKEGRGGEEPQKSAARPRHGKGAHHSRERRPFQAEEHPEQRPVQIPHPANKTLQVPPTKLDQPVAIVDQRPGPVRSSRATLVTLSLTWPVF